MKLDCNLNFSLSKNKIFFMTFIVFKQYLRGLIYSSFFYFLIKSFYIYNVFYLCINGNVKNTEVNKNLKK